MHQFYWEATLTPNEMIPQYFLWEKLFSEIHFALVSIKEHDGSVPVGISFPQFDREQHSLGLSLRLFAPTIEILRQMPLDTIQRKYASHVRFSEIQEIPNQVNGYATWFRVRIKSNVDRVARRRAKRKNISFEEAKCQLSDKEAPSTRAPYIQIRSYSGDQRFRLFLDFQLQQEPHAGTFTCYGLSRTSTVPVF